MICGGDKREIMSVLTSEDDSSVLERSVTGDYKINWVKKMFDGPLYNYKNTLRNHVCQLISKARQNIRPHEYRSLKE